jgi:hypothetical protein
MQNKKYVWSSELIQHIMLTENFEVKYMRQWGIINELKRMWKERSMD